jgi:hypothetical protein
MKLVKLSVERFQCIEAAEVELGPGLNVMFGPNDLGKTSLAWAIRAVLLLQHGSAAHTRFVSWHGGGDPTVTLTLTDDTDRYWRIKKVFASGSAGRSLLESSKDGRTFREETNGRGVDEKLRALLRWGVHTKLGGRGGPQGLPASFLTHVLLADQDDVRKILFDVSLDSDPDESGRERLREALGALAQDPQFKAILDRAQAQVDKAFTATGRPKRGVGSPFVEISDRLEDLQRQRDELRQKEKETELAEQELQTKNAERDRLTVDLEQTRELFTRLEVAFIAQERRDVLVRDLEAEKARLERATTLQASAHRSRVDLDRYEQDLRHSATLQDQLREQLAKLDSERIIRRAVLDESTAAASSTPSDEQRARLDSLREESSTATRRADATKHEHQEAIAIATAIEAQAAALREANDAVLACERAHEAARGQDQIARSALEGSRHALRDATSGDQARAREVRAAELAKRSAEIDAVEAALARQDERVAACEQLASTLANAEAARSIAIQKLEVTKAIVAEGENNLARIDQDTAFLERVLRYDDLVAARNRLAAAREADEQARRAVDSANRFRIEAEGLRTKLRPGVPDLATVDRLQQLHNELRLAEAKLGAVTVQLRPVRPLTVTIQRDGMPHADREIAEPTVLSAAGRLVLTIEGVGELDVSGGDDGVRAEVANLRARWHAEGLPVLHTCEATTIEHLVLLRRDTDRTLAEIDERLWEAQANQELARRTRPDNLDVLTREVDSIAIELGNDDAIAAHHRKAEAGVRRDTADQIDRIKRERLSVTNLQQTRREAIARQESEVESLARSVAETRASLSAQQEVLHAPWTEVRKRTNTERERVRLERLDLHQLADSLRGESSTSEATARAAVVAAEARIAGAKSELANAERSVAQAREARSRAQAALDASIERARLLDAGRGALGDLAGNAPVLDVGPLACEAASAAADADRLRTEIENLVRTIDAALRTRQTAAASARNALGTIEAALEQERERLAKLIEGERSTRANIDLARAEETRVKVELAAFDTNAMRFRIDTLKRELAGLPCESTRYDRSQLRAVEVHLQELSTRRDDLDRGIERARGGLEKVGGAVVREQTQEIEVAIRTAQAEQHQIEVEYRAWQLLVEALRASEATESQHLGRHLAAPVSDRFHNLTGGRYGAVELDAHLVAQGLHAAGHLREISALSAGTQDQLATLLRLCIAEQVKSSIVLDDHLSQSDPARIAWFNGVLRAAATGVQIIVITCRPGELLSPDELPVTGERSRSVCGGLTRAIALEHSIRRFAR